MSAIRNEYISVGFKSTDKPIKALVTRRYMTHVPVQWIERDLLSAHIFRLNGNGKLYYVALDDKKVLSKGECILHPAGNGIGDFTASIYGRNYLFGITKKVYNGISEGDHFSIELLE